MSFSTTIAVFIVALSRMPMTSTIVISRHNAESENIENDRNAENMRRAGEQARNSRGRPVIGGDPVGNRDAEARDERLEIIAPADGDSDIADGVFDDQVPSDDPGNQFAERGIGIGICAAGDRNHRRKFGVT